MPPRPRRRIAGLGVALLVLVALATPAHAQEPTRVVARDAALSVSASCSQGDVEITYDATGMVRTAAQLTGEAGTVLDRYDEIPFTDDYSGLEYVLLDADPPGAPGSVLGAYVVVGAEQPTAATSADFFVAWRCDPLPDDEGGRNVVLLVCAGPYGTSPQTVPEALALLALDRPPADCTIPVEPATPLPATPRLTG